MANTTIQLNSLKKQRCEERINRKKEEAKLIAETEQTKCDLDLQLLNIHLQNAKIQTEDYEEERDEFHSENKSIVQKYPIPNKKSERKGRILLWAVLLLDLIIGTVTMGAIISEGMIAMIGSSLAAAALFYVSGYWSAATEKDTSATASMKAVASVLKLCVFFLVLSMSVLRFNHASENEAIAIKVFLFVFMLCLGAIAYLLSYALCFQLYQTKANVHYHSLRAKAEEFDKERLEFEFKKIEREKAKSDFLLENELNLNRQIQALEDNLDNTNIQIQKDAEIAEHMKQEAIAASNRLTAQKEAEKQKELEAEAAVEKKRERRRKRFSSNGAAALLLSLFAFFGCSPTNSQSTVQSIFIDPSGGSVNVIDVLGTGENVLLSLGNDIESPNAAHGKVDVFIMQEQTGTVHHSISTPVLSLTAGFEQKKTRRELQDFISDWDEMKKQIQFPQEGYKQSRIAKPLFDVIRHTLTQPYGKKQIILHTDLLEHTQEMSFLKMSPEEIRNKEDTIVAFIDHYCRCQTLQGLEVQFAYRSRTEPKYDQHRVEVERIFEAYFLTKGAQVSRFLN